VPEVTLIVGDPVVELKVIPETFRPAVAGVTEMLNVRVPVPLADV
jgi:hypothetical protein